MIQVTVGTTTERTKKNYTPDTTVRSILDDNAVDYSVATVMIDGANMGTDDIDKSLAALGKTEKCMIIAVVKAESAL